MRRPRLGLIADFDGTIAEIAPTPDESRISARCAESLSRLAPKVALVSVVSGRSVADLSERVGLDGVMYVGNHGAEYLSDGQLSIAPGATEHRAQIKAVFEHLRATADGPGLMWQDKGFSASVHYRLSPSPAQAGKTLAAVLQSTPGVGELEVFWGKLVLEIRSAKGLHKGYALRKLCQDNALDAAIFLGDDTTDLDALRALKELATERGLSDLGVAVIHEDSPAELSEAAEYSLNGVAEVEAFLSWLDTVTRVA